MSLPPGFLEELRERVSLVAVVGRKVAWDMRKSNQGKGDMWAPCPFHQEKTASFHVDERKGYYYCFGCHAKGDAISFLRETANMSFMEAVGALASEAGMVLPERDPRAAEAADARTRLVAVMEQAVRHYRMGLNTAAAAPARAYLARRGLSPEAQARWEIGFAPEARQGLFGHLTGAGVPADMVVEAGLAARPEGGGPPYDRFRGRIIFPIRDACGRAIALGGRALDPNARAKYLNSPETPLFDKGRTLYNIGPARAAVGQGAPLIVAEGYMDVIALSEAGFAGAVAPLGTAITETQLALLWRLSPEPIIALDGDKAGLRAAYRLIDLALPRLVAGNSLRFALMPPGQDPDDVIRAGGAAAMAKLVEAARPMSALLWQRETEARSFDSPERRAAFDKALRLVLSQIADPAIRRHYGDEMARLRGELFRAQGRPAGAAPGGPGGRGSGWGKGGGRWPAPGAALPRPATRASLLVTGAPRYGEELREAVILASLVCHPGLIARFEAALERLECITAPHAALRDALLGALGTTDPQALRGVLEARLGPEPLEKLFAPRHVQIAPPVRDRTDAEKAALCIAEELALLEARRGAEREVAEAMEDISGLADEGVTWRLGQAAAARAGRVAPEAEGAEVAASDEFEIGPNGARISRGERDAFGALLGEIDFGKAGRR